MELKIVNPDSTHMHTEFGISEQRSNEIADKLDVSMLQLYQRSPLMVGLSQIMVEAAKPCDTPEELAFSIITTLRWWRLKGLDATK